MFIMYINSHCSQEKVYWFSHTFNVELLIFLYNWTKNSYLCIRCSKDSYIRTQFSICFHILFIKFRIKVLNRWIIYLMYYDNHLLYSMEFGIQAHILHHTFHQHDDMLFHSNNVHNHCYNFLHKNQLYILKINMNFQKTNLFFKVKYILL